MLVVADTSALLALAASDSLELLTAVFGDIRVPRAVFEECAVPGKPGADRLAAFLAGRVETIDLAAFVIAAPGLGRGELEAMALYKRLTADRLLVDDGRARRVARANGIEVVGSLGVLLVAKSAGHIDAVRPRIEAVHDAGIFLSKDLVAEAIRLAGET